MSYTEKTSSINTDSQHKYALQSKRMDLEAGLLGKVFGVSQIAPINIAGIIAILLVASGVASLFIDTSVKADEFWKIIVPILSMILGYLFGKKA